jgi:hypothetical protein
LEKIIPKALRKGGVSGRYRVCLKRQVKTHTKTNTCTAYCFRRLAVAALAPEPKLTIFVASTTLVALALLGAIAA